MTTWMFVILLTFHLAYCQGRKSSSELTYCNQIPENPINGRVNCTDKKNFGSVCKFNCNHGYQLEGSSSIECIERENRWSSSPPSCSAITCPLLQHPINGMIRCSNGNRLRSTCIFKCNEGFLLFPFENSCFSCSSNRSWTNSLQSTEGANQIPSCILSRCNPIQRNPINGFVKCKNRNDYGSNCSFTCNIGYLIEGPSSILCTATGKESKWSDNPPHCRPAKLDIMFVLDGSDSIGLLNFRILKRWVINIAQSFDLKSGNILIGVIQYSEFDRSLPLSSPRQRYIRTEIGLGEYRSQSAFEVAVSDIIHFARSTDTGAGLKKAILDLKNSSRFPNSSKVITLFTDGDSTDSEVIPKVVEDLRKFEILTVAVGIGNADLNELKLIASNGHVFYSHDISSIDLFIEDIVQAILEFASPIDDENDDEDDYENP